MILTTFTRPRLSEEMIGRFKRAGEFLRATDFSALRDGVYPICGEEIYAMVQSFATSDPIDAEFETHRAYADVQYVISGRLDLQIAAREALTAATEYQTGDDVVFYRRTEQCSLLRLQPGQAAILFPWDAHRMVLFPKAGETARIRKCVIKVRMETEAE